MTEGRLRPLAYLTGAVALWGTSFAVTKAAYSTFPPMTVMWLRMVVAFAVFLPLLPRVKRPEYRTGDWKLLALSAMLLPCAYFGLEGFAITFTTSSQAGVISAVMPLMVAIGAWAVLREQTTWRAAMAIVASIVGVVVLSVAGVEQASAPNPLLGNLLELGAMIAAAGSTIAIKHLSSRYDPWLLTGLQMAIGCIFFAPLALASGPVDWAAVPVQGWLSVAYLGAGCGLAAFGLYNSALRLVPATQAALMINLIPAVAMVTGWLALGEKLTPIQVAACVLIVAAVSYSEVSGRRARELVDAGL